MCGPVPGPGGTVGKLARVAFCQRDEFLDRGGRHFGIDHQPLRHDGELGQAGERLAHVPGHRLADEMHRGGGRRRQVERVAVRRLAMDILHGRQGAAAGPVLDHELLVQLLGQVLGDQPREGVAAAAGGGGNDDPDRAAGIVALRCRRGGQKLAEAEGQAEARQVLRSMRSSDIRRYGRAGYGIWRGRECGPNARFPAISLASQGARPYIAAISHADLGFEPSGGSSRSSGDAHWSAADQPENDYGAS